jgi:hypothetical protein
LELAAKAAGLSANLKWGPHGFQTYAPPANWNPLTDDGDALRLAVKAGVSLSVTGRAICVSGRELSITDNVEVDDCSRLRLAIVRAAAEIGRSRP